jgi:hypothetical protein
MDGNYTSVLNSKMRNLLGVIIGFIIVSAILFNNGNSVYSISNGNISGIGYGNNGERFGSYVACSEADVIHYFRGSSIHFETALSDNSAVSTNSDTPLGSWVVEFVSDNTQSPVRIGGQIIESNLSDNNYTLLGEKTFDDVCNNIGNTITLTGGCGENTKIWFSGSNNEKVGSLTPPNGEKIDYLFGSEVNCF